MGQTEISLPYGGKALAAEIEVKNEIEQWNEYVLEDGNIIRMKCVLLKVLKTNLRDEITGEPQYILRTQNLVTVEKRTDL